MKVGWKEVGIFWGGGGGGGLAVPSSEICWTYFSMFSFCGRDWSKIWFHLPHFSAL